MIKDTPKYTSLLTKVFSLKSNPVWQTKSAKSKAPSFLYTYLVVKTLDLDIFTIQGFWTDMLQSVCFFLFGFCFPEEFITCTTVFSAGSESRWSTTSLLAWSGRTSESWWWVGYGSAQSQVWSLPPKSHLFAFAPLNQSKQHMAHVPCEIHKFTLWMKGTLKLSIVH